MGQKWKLPLPQAQENGTDYLVAEDDIDGTGGAYVYYLSTINPAQGFDSWHETLAEALDMAAEYGCSLEDWQSMPPEA
ncbi:hypothetical protein [Hymenobacter jeollabukensis]|uniref:Uncharacterized protein n=1 Tax=Hymenobacter jeollabukensis TaxID=2025313 RepID=A0A5R8WXS7_9BACT|nr:hypothetical protein [Hymenobacter jeollabukensis]TLM96863.1 hypothetical protein FDY95_02405 [Hymenobacter jeollabukensis]